MLFNNLSCSNRYTIVLDTYLKRWLHRCSADNDMLRWTGHCLIAGLTQNTRDQLVLERIRPSVSKLTAHVSTAIDLIQIIVVCGSITDQPLHLIRQLIIYGERYVLRCIRHKVNQSRCRLATKKKGT